MPAKAISRFLAEVDTHKAAITRFPNFVALFGGALSPAASRKKTSLSQRDAFLKWCTTHHKDICSVFLIPERFEEWKDFNIYSDLVLFEQDLGYLTSAVLVFLENAGAIAELGAFSQIPSLRDRLVVVISQHHFSQKSFIVFGPLRSITETNHLSDGICVLPDVTLRELPLHLEEVWRILSKKRERKVSTQAFDPNDQQHQILIALDLINLFLVVQETELSTLLQHFNVQIDSDRLRKILFLLRQTRLVHLFPYGNNRFYVSLTQDAYVDYTGVAPTPPKIYRPFNRARFTAYCTAEVEKDPGRRSAAAARYEMKTGSLKP